MSAVNFPSRLGLTDIGKVPVVSKFVDQLVAECIISEKQRRDLTTLVSNQDKWRELLNIVERENSISKFHKVLLGTEYKDVVAVAKIPDSKRIFLKITLKHFKETLYTPKNRLLDFHIVLMIEKFEF